MVIVVMNVMWVGMDVVYCWVCFVGCCVSIVFLYIVDKWFVSLWGYLFLFIIGCLVVFNIVFLYI